MGLVIGTCRGPACLEVFFPIGTGHPGSAGPIRDRRGRSGFAGPIRDRAASAEGAQLLAARRCAGLPPRDFQFRRPTFRCEVRPVRRHERIDGPVGQSPRPRPTAVRRRWRVRWHPVHFGDGLCGIAHRRRIAGDCAHHISDRAPERFHGTFNLLGPLLAGSGVQQNRRVEATVARHRPLEDADRSRQARHAVAPFDPARVAVAAAWRGCHNVEEFMAQRRPACLTWILPDAAEETR